MDIPLSGIGNSNESHKIIGGTLIDHKLRTRLLLTCLEYVVLDYFYHFKFIEQLDWDAAHVYRYTGLRRTHYDATIDRLIKKGIITDINQVSDKVKLLMNYDEIFEKIWELFKKNPGVKKAGRKMFDKAIKKYPKDLLLNCAKNYSELKKDAEKKYFMHVSSFLNPDEEKFSLYTEAETPETPKVTKRYAEW